MGQPAGQPPLPLTYTDLVCVVDVDPLANETTSDLQNLVQDCYHVILETLGSNPDDTQRGCGVELYLSGTSDQLATLPALIEANLCQDNRVTQAICSLTTDSLGTGYTISVQVVVSSQVIGLSFALSNLNGFTLNGFTTTSV